MRAAAISSIRLSAGDHRQLSPLPGSQGSLSGPLKIRPYAPHRYTGKPTTSGHRLRRGVLSRLSDGGPVMTPNGNGKHPGGRPQKPVDLDRARELLASGLSLRKTAETMRLGYGTLHRAIRGAKDAAGVIQNPGRSTL
jgi:hypothetical protein